MGRFWRSLVASRFGHQKFRSGLLLVIFASFSCNPVFSQNLPDVPLKFPWAGGMNSCQFGSIDINLDAKPDLIIFDRYGNRILPFINEGSTGEINYSFHPEYSSLFPDIHDWVIFADYNCDGKQDIFTYSVGGVRVFKNVSDTSLKFQLITDLLTSFYYTGKVGILVTPVDYPAIADIDGDGDMDLLTFFGLGSYVEYHKNLSIEKNGNCDSLDFRLSDKCWGDFKESEGGNKVTLDITCPYKFSGISGLSCNPSAPKHTGSTLLAADLNGDGMKDLILGDIDFPNLISLTNGGTLDSAHMNSQDSTFPGNPYPIWLFSFPSCSYLDLDNDGIRDLVVSPFDPSLYKTENKYSCWFYKNTGTNDQPVFEFRTHNFFQNEMIDVGTNSFPVVTDVNGDGLPDLLIGNYGYYDSSFYYQATLQSVFSTRISYYKNTGPVNNPSFHLVTDDFGNLSGLKQLAAYPAFGDPDGDGDVDMITGNADGTLSYFQNTAGTGQDPVFTSLQTHYMNIDAGDFSAPQLYDLDADGLPDLVIGNQKGKIVYYHNEGTGSSPLFVHVTDSLGRVNVTNYSISYDGFSTPYFFKDLMGKTCLIVGCEEGKVHLFTNIDGNLSGIFTQADSLLPDICGTAVPSSYGYRTAATIANLQDSNYPDLIVGNFSGGLNYFSHKSQPVVYTGTGDTESTQKLNFTIYPNPANQFVIIKPLKQNNNGPYEILVTNTLGQPVYRSSVNTGNSASVSLESFPTGLYFISISPQTEQGTFYRFTVKLFVIR
ncbi:MAG: FG-GAP-like repeat-containing protein [Bacteroidetes bacterium]|nr:FG-GAP-like repeat-containing protein [Bacteroidota bacterium]